MLEMTLKVMGEVSIMASVTGARVLLASIMGGVASHILFNKFEPRRPITIISLILGPSTVLGILLCLSNVACSAKTLLRLYAIHVGSLIASSVAYRLSPYHPLAAFPGPIICKITRFWAFYIAYTGKQHKYYQSLHAHYGRHVRTGPNHIHVSDADALPTVMGIKYFIRGERSGMSKIHGSTGSVISITDPHEHAQRRKIWDRSMNTKALLGYHDMLITRIGQLIDGLEKHRDSVVDLASWLSCFSFDFMGDIAFGGTFHLLEQGSDVDGYMKLARRHAKYLETNGAIPWIKPFIQMLPGGTPKNSFLQFATEKILARRSRGSSRKDVFYHLLDEEGLGNEPLPLPTLILEAGLTIVAGSDTTGTALSNLFFYLLSNPDILARLQLEIDSVLPPGSDVFLAANADMKLLNAVINETLRLQPAVPSGVQRVLPVGSGGVNVAGRWIPEGTTVQVSAYSVHRDTRYFYPDPEHFRPDRWLETTHESKLEQSAYFPFSYGPTSCAGKGLALLELRTVVCYLIQKFEFELESSFTPADWEDELEDNFILVKGKLPVLVKVRKVT